MTHFYGSSHVVHLYALSFLHYPLFLQHSIHGLIFSEYQHICQQKIALQTVLGDSAQIRTTLQGFSSVLKDMSQVCDVTTLQEQLVEADRRVANVQESFTAPLSQLEHAAAVSLPYLKSSKDIF